MKKEYTVLITGASGYVGNYLVNTLSTRENINCICVDRVHGYDLSKPGWSKNLPERDVDIIYHLAQSQHYRCFPEGSKDMFDINVASTLELLEWARIHGVKRFFFASSGSVYENCKTGHIPLTENLSCEPSSMYSITKYNAEMLTTPYQEFFEIVIGRIFSIYGADQKSMLITNMINKIQSGKTISLANNLGIIITPLFISDCIKMLCELATVELEQPKLTVNLASNEQLSLTEITREIASQLNIKPIIEITDREPTYLCADTSLLKKYYSKTTTLFKIALTQILSSEVKSSVHN